MKIAVVNGANINFTGVREPAIYGVQTLDQINKQIMAEAANIAETNLVTIDLHFYHSNIEGEIVDYLQRCYLEKFDGIIINPGAFSYYSFCLRDAIAGLNMPVIEVHMSNNFAREEFRQKSIIAPVCRGYICGFKAKVYTLAVYAITKIILEVYE